MLYEFLKIICFHLCERILPKSRLNHSVFKTNRMDVFAAHLLGFSFISCKGCEHFVRSRLEFKRSKIKNFITVSAKTCLSHRGQLPKGVKKRPQRSARGWHPSRPNSGLLRQRLSHFCDGDSVPQRKLFVKETHLHKTVSVRGSALCKQSSLIRVEGQCVLAKGFSLRAVQYLYDKPTILIFFPLLSGIPAGVCLSGTRPLLCSNVAHQRPPDSI